MLHQCQRLELIIRESHGMLRQLARHVSDDGAMLLDTLTSHLESARDYASGLVRDVREQQRAERIAPEKAEAAEEQQWQEW